jgi:nucleolar protein 56
MDKDINTFSMRLKEWFAWHFPEMTKIVNDNQIYARLVLLFDAKRDACNDEALDEIKDIMLDEEKAQQVVDAAKISMGFEMRDEDSL